ALYLTFSKGSLLLAVPAALLFLALVRGGRRAWLGVGSGLILLGTALIPISRTARFRNTFSLQPGSTAFFRVKVWQSAWRILREHPLTGLGPDNFLYRYRTRYILPEAWAEPNLSHPHNVVLNFGVRLGVGGIAVLVWLGGRFWWSAWRGYVRHTDPQMRSLLLGLMGGMVAFWVHGMVDNAFFLTDLAYTFFLSLGIAEILNDRSAFAKPL
ncbi:MAG: O-antigen ligase family protein, partial [Caldilineae bacterium]